MYFDLHNSYLLSISILLNQETQIIWKTEFFHIIEDMKYGTRGSLVAGCDGTLCSFGALLFPTLFVIGAIATSAP